ncbi:hypothetical protein KE423_003908 [Salmonella enterica]|nr:hypothetical protein [Salmonella enterica]
MARSRVTIKDDRRGLDELQRELKALAGRRHVVAGITHAAGGEIMTYANANEFGAQARPHFFRATPSGGKPGVFFTSGTVPPRPFMRTYYDHNITKIGNFAIARFIDLLTKPGRTVEQTFSEIGLYVQDGIKKQITTAHQWAQKNAPLTIDLKGSTKPLINKGHMLGAVTFDIRTGR